MSQSNVDNEMIWASFDGKVRDIVSLDVYKAPYEEVLYQVQGLGRSERNRLLDLCQGSLTEESPAKNQSIRVVSARILVALLPESLTSINNFLDQHFTRYHYEIHFSLFCYLDWVSEIPGGDVLSSTVLDLVVAYLKDVESDTALAAWMAGDLLGDHWAPAESLPILLRLATEAKYVAGRSGALHGIEMILKKPTDRSNLDEIRGLLQQLARTDRSNKIREEAIHLIQRISQ